MTKTIETFSVKNLRLCSRNLEIVTQKAGLVREYLQSKHLARFSSKSHIGSLLSSAFQKVMPASTTKLSTRFYREIQHAKEFSCQQSSHRAFTHGLHFQYSRDFDRNSAPYKGVMQKRSYILSTKLQQPQISLSKPRFVNMLMNGGEKSRAYQVLLASIGTCKYKMLENRVLAFDLTLGTASTRSLLAELAIKKHTKHANTKSYSVASCREKARVIKLHENQRSLKQAPNPYRLHTGVQQAIGITKLALPLQSWVAQKGQSKRYLQSNQICGKTIYNVEPIVETRKVRVRGSTYQVPSTLHLRRRERMAICWIITNACMKRESNKETLSTSLGQEFFDCINRQGVSIKKRDQMYRLAANSRVYMRYKWW